MATRLQRATPPRRLGELVHSVGGEAVYQFRHLHGTGHVGASADRPRQSEGSKRVSARGLRDLDECRARQRDAELIANHVEEDRCPEASKGDGLAPERRRHCTADIVPRLPGSLAGQDAHRRGRDPPCRECQHVGARPVEPLEVVDREDHGAGFGEMGEQRCQPGTDRTLVQWDLGRCRAKCCDLQRMPLRRGQVVEGRVGELAEHVGQPDVAHGHLGLCRAALQYGRSPEAGEIDRVTEQCRLPDSRFAVDLEHCRTGGGCRYEDRSQIAFAFAADQRVHWPSPVQRSGRNTGSPYKESQNSRESPDSKSPGSFYLRRMRPISNYIALACSTALLIGVTAGCGGSAKTSSGDTNVGPSAASVVTATPTVPGTGSSETAPTPEVAATTSAPVPAADPTSDPCDLLTAAAAAQALGMPVGEPITQPGEGNTTCAYRPADPGAQGMVVLTLYGVTGSVAILDAAALQFPGAEPVDGLGDAARVSVQSQVIGVLTGSTVFAIGLYPQQADGQLLPVTKDQLVAAAHAVLDGQ